MFATEWGGIIQAILDLVLKRSKLVDNLKLLTWLGGHVY